MSAEASGVQARLDAKHRLAMWRVSLTLGDGVLAERPGWPLIVLGHLRPTSTVVAAPDDTLGDPIPGLFIEGVGDQAGNGLDIRPRDEMEFEPFWTCVADDVCADGVHGRARPLRPAAGCSDRRGLGARRPGDRRRWPDAAGRDRRGANPADADDQLDDPWHLRHRIGGGSVGGYRLRVTERPACRGPGRPMGRPSYADIRDLSRDDDLDWLRPAALGRLLFVSSVRANWRRR